MKNKSILLLTLALVAGFASVATAQEVKLYNEGDTCNAGAEGAVKYIAGSDKFQGCDGSAWADLGGMVGTSSGGDATTLDSLDSTQFVRADADDTTTGKITIDRDWALMDFVGQSGQTWGLRVNNTDGRLSFQDVTGGFGQVFAMEHTTGHVGIGKENPGHALDVSGTLNIGIATNYPTLRFEGNAGTEAGRIFGEAGTYSMFYQTVGTGDHHFRANGGSDYVATITNTGRFGLGGITSPAYLIDASADSAQLRLTGSDTGYINAAIVLESSQGTNVRGGGVFMYDQGGDTEWYMGTPYNSSDQLVFARKGGVTSGHDQSTAQLANTFARISNVGSLVIGDQHLGVTRYSELQGDGEVIVRYDDNSNRSALQLQNRAITAAGHGINIEFGLNAGAGSAINAGEIGVLAEDTFAAAANRDAGMYFSTISDGTFSERMRIRADGNVGIGLANPLAKLQVSGGGRFNVHLADEDWFVADSDKGSVANVIWYDYSSGRVYLGNTGGSGSNAEVTARGGMLVDQDTTATGLRVDHDGASGTALSVTGGGGGNPIASFVRDVGSTGSVEIHAGGGDPQITISDQATGVWSLGTDSTTNELWISQNSAIGTNNRFAMTQAGDVSITGSVTAGSFVGDGSGLTGLAMGDTLSSAAPILTLTDTDTGSDAVIDADSGAGHLELKADNNNEVAGSDIRFSIDGTIHMTLEDTGMLGLGTTNPTDDFTISTASPAIRFYDTDDVNGAYGQIVNSNDDLYIRADQGNATAGSSIFFAVDGTNMMELEDTGELGIGTTSPATDLHVYNTNVGADTTIRVENPDTTSGSLADFYALSGSSYLRNLVYGSGAAYTISNATYTLGTYGAYPMYFRTDTTDRMTISATGNVGIGTTSPSSPLHVVNSAAGGQLKLVGEGSTSGTYLGHFSGNTYIVNQDAAKSMNFGTANTTRMTLTSGGLLGVGTTTPSGYLDVYPPSGNPRQLVVRQWADISASGGGQALFASNAYRGSTANDYRYSNTHGSIGASGMAINSPAWGEISFFADTGATTADATFTPTTHLTIEPSGEVGIGTVDPAATLDVNGTIRATQICDEAGANCKDISGGWGASGGDAATLDTLDSLQFTRSDANDDVSGHTEWQDNFDVRLGTSADLRLLHDGTNSYINNYTGQLRIRNRANGGDIYIGGERDDGTYENTIAAIGGAGYTRAQLYYNAATKLQTKSDGIDVTGEVQADYIDVEPQDGTNEGGEIRLQAAGSHGQIQIDNYAGNLRVFTLASGKLLDVLGGGIAVDEGLSIGASAATAGTGFVYANDGTDGGNFGYNGSNYMDIRDGVTYIRQGGNWEWYFQPGHLSHYDDNQAALGQSSRRFTNVYSYAGNFAGNINASQICDEAGANCKDISGGWASSGGDAATLDSLDSTAFMRANATDTFSGGIATFKNDAGIDVTNTGGINGLQVRQDTASADALMSFHVAGDYAVHFGLDGQTNDLTVGGWSMGANKYKIWHAGNDGSSSTLDADLLDGLDSTQFLRSDTSDVLGGNLGFATANGLGVRFWNNEAYKIYMSAAGDGTWGGRLDSTSDYNMYFRMGAGTNRGFVFQNGTTELFQIESTGQVRQTGALIIDGQVVIDDGGGWHRSYGATGWYNGTYGGGWHMSDSSYLRNYGSKALLMSVTGTNPSSGIDTFAIRATGPWGGGISMEDGTGNVALYVQGSGTQLNFGFGTNLGAVTSVANLTNSGRLTATDFQMSSDRRLKTNIQPLESALDKVGKLRGVSYEWDKEAHPERTFEDGSKIGVIAQEVQEIFPEVVSADEEGELAVNYGALVAPLIEAVKELKAENEALKKRIEALEE